MSEVSVEIVMVIKFSRAQRRHDRMRMDKHVRQLEMYRWWKGGRSTEEELKQWYGRFRDNASRCSCSMCMNPRRGGWESKYPLTIAEKQAEDAYYDGLEEIEDEYGVYKR